MTTAEAPMLRLGGRRIPVVLPSIRDPRLHTAAVILTVHTVGITALGFRVSVPQILSGILAAALVDVVITFRQSGKLVWPASGMLTGSGVALILRLTEMQAGSYWDWTGWHLYAVVAAASVLTKHMIRWRGEHLFNPSNVGLVAVFVLLGSRVVEPLDFWWAPLGLWMTFAYAVIIVGGVLITRRLALFELAVTFWLVLAAGLAVLAANGHCMIAAWAPEPVCGGEFWRVLVTSPEILIFMLFMITDPKTIPSGRGARILFAASLGLLATLLIAPNSDEFGAKVGLLSSLVILSPVRGIFDRLPTTRSPLASPRRAFVNGVGVGVGLAVIGFGIVLAGLPARDVSRAVALAPPEVTVEVDPAVLPPVDADPAVDALGLGVDADSLAVTLAENLAIEAMAISDADSAGLAASSTGDRLAEMMGRVDDAVIVGQAVVDEYHFDSLRLTVHHPEPDQAQSSAALVFEAAGRKETLSYDASGSEVDRLSAPFASSFMLRRVGGERWLIASVD